MLSGCGSDGPADPGSVEASGETPSGCVWLATPPEGDGCLYLCGTIHILRPQDYPLAPAYETAYARADLLVFELPPGAGSSSELTQRMQERALLPEGTELSSLVDESTWSRVEAWAESRDLPLSFLQPYRPWFVALMMVGLEYSALGADSEQGVDHHFESRALKQGKDAEGLETVEFQIELFAGQSESDQLDMLLQTLDELEHLEGDFERMLESWKEGDLEALGELLFRDAERYPHLLESFLTDRNRNWLPELRQWAEEGRRVMVLVGAGHLVGETGLIELLRQQGYEVTRGAE